MKAKEFKNNYINSVITAANAEKDDFSKNLTLTRCVYNLAGDHNKTNRQTIYSELTGRKATKTESGVNNIFKEMKKYIKWETSTQLNQRPH